MKKYILPFFMLLIALALLAGGACLFPILLHKPGNTLQSKPVTPLSILILDDTWAENLLACESLQAQKDYLVQTVANADALGANALALTGFAPADASNTRTVLFRDNTKIFATAPALTASDTFFTQFDALTYLIACANEAASPMEILLVPTDTAGAICTTADGTAIDNAFTRLAVQCNLRFLAPSEDAVNSATATTTTYKTISLAQASENTKDPYTVSVSDTLIFRNDSNPVQLASALGFQRGQNVILGEYSALLADAAPLHLLAAYTACENAPDLFTAKGATEIQQTLAVTYPVEPDSTVYDANLFLMGTSNPDAPLTLDGAEIARFGTRGVWGTLIALDYGDNEFTLANGADTIVYTIDRSYWDGNSSSTLGNGKHSVLAQGQQIIVTEAIASTLTNAYNAGSIAQTLYRGAVAEVTHSLTRSPSDSRIFAYQLTTGEYIRAASCTLIEKAETTLSTPTLQQTKDGDLQLIFHGATPAVYRTWETAESLTLQFLSATITGELPANEWFDTAVTVDEQNTSVSFTFPKEDSLYGWGAVYDTKANTTTITLKHAPHLSNDPAAPLSGVHVLLDPGHGFDNDGAMGSAGKNAPQEKDLNLALALATQYRLEQLGATVSMSRTDDSFPTLEDRVTQLNETNADYFISIHHNSIALSSDVNTATGTEAYYFFAQSQSLADGLCEQVTTATQRKNRGTYQDYYYVTRSNICPAVLLEIGFMTNPAEYELLEADHTIWLEAAAITEAIYKEVTANG